MDERLINRLQRRTCALEALSCEEISSTDSSDSSNDENEAKHIYAEGSNFKAPASPLITSPPVDNSEDSNSRPFDVTSFEEIVASLASGRRKSTDSLNSRDGEECWASGNCFYALSEHCLDLSPALPDRDQYLGVLHYVIELYRYITRSEQGNFHVAFNFRPWFVFSFTACVLTLAFFGGEDPVFVSMCLALLSFTYLVQHMLWCRKVKPGPSYCRNFQKFLEVCRVHNVLPCSTCRDQFTQQGIFDFHNRVSSRLSKAHMCTPPYCGYDYLVAYLIWSMDKVMLEMRGEGFLTVETSSSDENFTARPRYHSTHAGAAAGLRARGLNANNSNSNMDYLPPESSCGEDQLEDYETPSSDSNTSMDYLALSQEEEEDDDSESEGYHTALHQHSPTTSMNVLNDDAVTTTTTYQEDYSTFSLYTSRSSVTADTYDEDEEEEEEDESVSADASTTISSNLSVKCTAPSCNGSERTQQGSENDTTKSQYGSEFTKEGTIMTKSAPNSSRSRRNPRAPKPSKAVGDHAMVNQLISQSIKEHLAITSDASEAEMLIPDGSLHGTDPTQSVLPRQTYDTMNKNNNGNKFTRPSGDRIYEEDEEANIVGYGELNMESDGDEDDDDAVSADHVPCTLVEENAIEMSYADSTGSLDNSCDSSVSEGKVNPIYHNTPPTIEVQFADGPQQYVAYTSQPPPVMTAAANLECGDQGQQQQSVYSPHHSNSSSQAINVPPRHPHFHPFTNKMKQQCSLIPREEKRNRIYAKFVSDC